MCEKKEKIISDIRKKIEMNNEGKLQINRMRQESEEFHYNKIKRLNSYINSESLSDADRLMYSDKIHSANKKFLAMDDEYENAIRQLDKSNEECEEQIRELEKQGEEESEDDDSENDDM